MPSPTRAISTSFSRLVEDLKRKRTIQGFLNYGIVAFGPEKKDAWIRIGKKSLIETPFASWRYIALVDVGVILGLILWFFGNPIGFPLFIFSFVLAFVVFVDANEVERHAHALQKTVKKPVKEVAEKMVRVAKKKIPKVPLLEEK